MKNTILTAAMLLFQSAYTPQLYAQKVQQPSSIEEVLVKTQVTNSHKQAQNMAQKYNPNVDYQVEYEKVKDKIWTLPLVQYRNSHFLADNKNTYTQDNVRIELSDTYDDLKTNTTKPKTKPTMDLWLKYDQVEHQHWDPQQKKIIKQDRIVKEYQALIEANCTSASQCSYQLNLPANVTPTSNEIFYLAVINANTVLTTLQKENKTWQKKPWKQPKQEYKTKPPIDQKTGEFLFYGEDWCKPCHEIAEHLFEQKIPFQEQKRQDDDCNGVPYIVDQQDRCITGKPEIDGIIRELYSVK